MRILTIDDNMETALSEACAVLAADGLVALPTETVYGLAADATRGAAVARIFEAKGRPRFNPLICHVSDVAMARRHVRFDRTARLLAEAFWPGPLTLVLPALPGSAVHPLASAGLQTLAVRAPSGFAQKLIQRYGRPLAAPSANTSGRISPTRAAHVAADLGERVDLILDGGAAPIGLESTIVKPYDGGVELLRPGGLAASDIETVLRFALTRGKQAGAAIDAPGMLPSHYAPRTPLTVNAANAATGDAIITFGGRRLAGCGDAAIVLDLSPSGDLREAAANLFDHLKTADASGAARIAVAPVPHTGLGEAINDRLARAAAPTEDTSVAARHG